MKVGDYVRTDIGEIGKLEDLKLEYTKGKRLVTYYTYREVKENLVVFDNKNITQRFVNGSSIYLTDDELKNVEDSIIKSSPNIIDLIEVGDYVNGLKVSSVGGTYYGRKDKAIYCDYCENKETGKWTMIYDDEIKSIVTKEQFSSMEYKVGE